MVIIEAMTDVVEVEDGMIMAVDETMEEMMDMDEEVVMVVAALVAVAETVVLRVEGK